MGANALTVVFATPGEVSAQSDNLTRGGLLIPAPQPPPEPFADLTVRLVGPDGATVTLPARVVHLGSAGEMTLSFVDPFEARDLLAPLLDVAAQGAPAAPAPPRVSWGEAAATGATTLPESAVLGTAGTAAAAADAFTPLPPLPETPGAGDAPPLASTLDAAMADALHSAEQILGAPEERADDEEEVGDDLGEPGTSEESSPPEEPGASEDPSIEEERANLYDQIRSMTVSERIKLAKHGDRTARTLLIRDVHKTIHVHVIQNPHITVDEVRFIAGYKQTNPEALKMIADNREWVQNPRVVSALVANPKTPTQTALKLLEKLPGSELRRIAKSDHFPRAVTLAARKKVVGP